MLDLLLIWGLRGIFGTITQNAEWVAVLKEEKDILFAEVYYNNDWQYTIYIKEMEVI